MFCGAFGKALFILAKIVYTTINILIKGEKGKCYEK
jgi:hypothetical protein